MIISLSEEAKRQNIIDHIDKNIFVEAGAGAGKTTLIVSRIVNQIRQGMKPENLVVITFTNAAAGELFERIEKAFEKEEKNPDNPETIREYFKYAIENIEQMTISTIHSFCFKLLKERCFDAKLPLDVSLLENEEALERQQKFFAGWLAGLDKNSISEIKEAVSFRTGNVYYKYWIERAFLNICEKPLDVNVVCAEDTILAGLKQALVQKKNVLNQLQNQIEQEMQQFATAFITIINREKKCQITLEQLAESGEIYAAYKPFFAGLLKRPNKEFMKAVAKLYTEAETKIYKEGRGTDKTALNINIGARLWLESNLLNLPETTYDKWKQLDNEIKEQAETYTYYVLMKYATKATVAYRNTLDGHKVSNDELLQRTKELVWNSSAAAEYFGEKYKCIYVDEFQDTDHVQADLVWKLAEAGNGQLRKGALFIVGDPKQAIYRFRGGEPRVYYDIKKAMEEIDQDTEVYELDNNYRSNKEIISWVNEQFAPAIDGDIIRYRDMKCASSTITEEAPDNGVNILKGVYHLNTLSGGRTSQMVYDEACGLAKFISQLVNGNYGIYETVRKEDNTYIRKWRKITYQDFLVLCWTKNDMKEYLQEMERLSIPVEISGKVDIAENRVLQSFVNLLRYLRCPYDKKAKEVASYMVADEDVLISREIAPDRLKRLRDETMGMNGGAVARYLTEHLEYLLPLDVIITQTQMLSVQAKLRQMVETVLITTKESPTMLVEAFEHYLDSILERELPLQENQNAVRFMNLHKAKGLEGNITILMNRKGASNVTHMQEYTSGEKNVNGQFDHYSVLPPELKGIGSDVTGYGLNPETEKAANVAIEEDNAERIRLEYVAATRAKEVLVVMKEFGDNAPFSRYTVPSANNANFVVNSQNCSNPVTQFHMVTEPVGVQTVTEEKVLKKTYISLSPSMLEGNNGDEEDKAANEPIVEEPAERRTKGNVFGTTMHRSFELLVKRRKEEKLSVDACICQAIMENSEELLSEGKRSYLKEDEVPEEYLTAVRDYLKKALGKFLDCREIQNLLDSAKEIYTELPFSYYTSREEDEELFADIEKHLTNHKIEIENGQPVWINGTADLVILTGEGEVHIIDYKSDTKRTNSMELFESIIKRKYEGQMLLYQHSMSRLFGVPRERIKVRLYHLY